MDMRKIIWVMLLLLAGADVGIRAQTAPSDLAGTIAYLGDDYNVYTFTPALDQISVLTRDASRRRHYLYPTWAKDGRLAYFCCEVQRSASLEVYITDDPTISGELVYMADDEIFTYAAWSPASTDLAVLIGRVRGPGFKVELLHQADGVTTHEMVGTGAPYYFSWSPDGARMLWHRNNQRIDIFDVGQNASVSTLNIIPGNFAVPAWSPLDDRLLLGQLNTERMTTDLVIYDQGESTPLATGINGLIAFNWSPDGQYVAYRVINRSGYGKVVVLDAASGQEIASSSSDTVIAFFWSPDSQSIAFITPARRSARNFDASYAPQLQQREIELTWSLLDLNAGNSRRLVNFNPTNEMLYVLTYFDQFAQSHRFWSPDSRALVYGEIASTGEPTISILDITDNRVVPFSVGQGVLGIWSYQ